MEAEKMTGRFWMFHRVGWVKLSVRPGETLRCSYGGPTDEGWSRYSETFTHDGTGIVNKWCSDGRDCDGRHTRYGAAICPIERLKAGSLEWVEDAPGPLPEWTHLDARQRDEFAEAMGY